MFIISKLDMLKLIMHLFSAIHICLRFVCLKVKLSKEIIYALLKKILTLFITPTMLCIKYSENTQMKN